MTFPPPMNPDLQPQMSPMNTDEPAAEKHLRPSVPSAAKKEHAPKISVIVPVYKVEKYLPECIESVLAQTFTDFELILVDDGSPDNSGAICDAYAARDPRIRVFHKENGGVSSARNLGLDHARGEWIAFVDSDDWLSPEYLNRLIRGTDAAVCISAVGFTQVHETTRERVSSRLRCETVVAAAVPAAFARASTIPFWAPWAKLFRNPKRRNKTVRFRENIHYAEDWIFLLEYLKSMRGGIRFLDDVDMYFYRRYENSSSMRFFGFERELEWYRLGKNILLDFIGVQAGWAWSWQTSILQSRVFPCVNFQSTAQRETFERELSDFRKFYVPTRFVEKISKVLLSRRFYRTLSAFNASRTLARTLKERKMGL